MGSFFQEYKKRREEQEISLQEISERTKITLHFLRAIEDGNFDILPETYVRLFLRSYAREIGVDPDEAVEQLETYLGKTVEIKPEPEEKKPKKPDPPKKDKSISSTKINTRPKPAINWKRSILLILLFAFLLWGIKSYVGSDTSRSPSQPINVEAPTESSPEPITPDTTGETISDETLSESDLISSSQQSIPTLQDNNPITLQFEAIGRTWVRITRDTLSSEEYIFLPQDSQTFEARERIQLRVGNSAGARLTVNGEEIGRLGAQNTITDLEITQNGIITKENFAPPEEEVETDTLAS